MQMWWVQILYSTYADDAYLKHTGVTCTEVVTRSHIEAILSAPALPIGKKIIIIETNFSSINPFLT
jgi:hypothetical protein